MGVPGTIFERVPGTFLVRSGPSFSTANCTTKKSVYPKIDIGINYTEFTCDFFKCRKILTTRGAGTIFSEPLRKNGEF